MGKPLSDFTSIRTRSGTEITEVRGRSGVILWRKNQYITIVNRTVDTITLSGGLSGTVAANSQKAFPVPYGSTLSTVTISQTGASSTSFYQGTVTSNIIKTVTLTSYESRSISWSNGITVRYYQQKTGNMSVYDISGASSHISNYRTWTYEESVGDIQVTLNNLSSTDCKYQILGGRSTGTVNIGYVWWNGEYTYSLTVS